MKKQIWTPAERRTLKILRDQGMSYREIGRVLNRSKDSVVGKSRPYCKLKDGDIYETDEQAEYRKQLYGEASYA